MLVACVAFALVLLPASDALGSESEITRAEASSDWSQGSIAGSARWGGCFPSIRPPILPTPSPVISGCAVQAFLTVGSGSDPSQCSDPDRHWPHSDEQVTLAWSSGSSGSGGSAAFEVLEVPLSGEPGQLACLAQLETYEERPACAFEPVPCVQWIRLVANYDVLASALLKAPPAPSPPEASPSPPEVSPLISDGTSILVEPPPLELAPSRAQGGGEHAGRCRGKVRHGQHRRGSRSACMGLAGARSLAH